MPSIRRRRFLASLLAAPLGFSTFSTSFAVEGDLRRTTAQDDSDLIAGCVAAWESHNRSDDLIDFWAARASDIDTTAFSSCVQRVVLWDDVFSLGTVQRRVDEINAAILMHYGFDCRLAPSGFALHLEGVNTVDQTLVRTFEPKAPDPKRVRIALIDLASCGVTALDWSQIIPSLRGQYDLIIGVAPVTHRCTNPDKVRPIGSGGSFIYESTWGNMKKCDLSIVYSDSLLCGYSGPELEKIDSSPSDLISSLAFALNDQKLIRRLSKRNVSEHAISPVFGIGGLAARLTDEGHFEEVSARQKLLAELFGPLSEEQAVLMLDAGDESKTIGTLSLWPITMKWN
jgi:hypothetical protein